MGYRRLSRKSSVSRYDGMASDLKVLVHMKFRSAKFTPRQNFNDRYPTVGTHSIKRRKASNRKTRPS